MSFWNIFRKDSDVNFEIKPRILNPMYIKDEKHRSEYIKNGYVIIRNVVNNSAIDKVLTTFDEITKLPGYFESERLQTTIAFGETIHNIAINTVKEVSETIFSEILNPDLCIYDFGGGIIVKNKGCWFAPHQDCSIIDEYESTTTYAWIPTVDMNDNNGTFYAIPGSHLWAAWQRSSQYPSWPLKKHSQFLWKQMIPLYLNKGDLLLFDSALIHASGENKTNEKRIAFNACIIDKNAQHVQYVLDNATPKGKIEKYLVDIDFWYKGNLNGRPSGYKKMTENVFYPKEITKDFLIKQIKKYYPNE